LCWLTMTFKVVHSMKEKFVYKVLTVLTPRIFYGLWKGIKTSLETLTS
jgi:hypothetical protein